MDPSTGRFTSVDPYDGCIECAMSLHRYLYTNMNPVNNADPTGESFLAGMVAAASIMATFTVVATATYYDILGVKGGNRIPFEDCWFNSMNNWVDRTFSGFGILALSSGLGSITTKPLTGFAIPENGSEFTSLVRAINASTRGKIGLSKAANWLKKSPTLYGALTVTYWALSFLVGHQAVVSAIDCWN
jgi:hypothetical protein